MYFLILLLTFKLNLDQNEEAPSLKAKVMEPEKNTTAPYIIHVSNFYKKNICEGYLRKKTVNVLYNKTKHFKIYDAIYEETTGAILIKIRLQIMRRHHGSFFFRQN